MKNFWYSSLFSITVTAGTGTGRFAKLATLTMLEVRRGGQGKKEHKKPVLSYQGDKNARHPMGDTIRPYCLYMLAT